MSKPEGQSNRDYDIVIIQCCENCETHQQFARHSQWKYFEQFNQLKRKIEKFVNNTIVIKNPVPDELIKTAEIKSQKNLFINKLNSEKIIFPRIGSFEIYMFNILISSKLMTTQWPNHYKVLQVIAKMIQQKKKGNSLDHFSVYYQTGVDSKINFQPSQQPSAGISPDKRNNVRIVSKKKKGNSLAGKAYRSIEKGHESLRDPRSTLDPISQKLMKDQAAQAKSKRVHRYLESKVETRVKLPSLSNTLKNFKQDEGGKIEPVEHKQPKKKVINTIDEIQRQQLSVIQHKNSAQFQAHKMSFLQKQSSVFKNSLLQEPSLELKFMQNQSIQYSQQQGKDFMNRSIQYQEQQGFYCDFGMGTEFEYLIKQKQLNFHWVQTERVEFKNDNKPYTLDQEVEANIIVKVPAQEQQTQTVIKYFLDQNVGTDVLVSISRQIQFPQQIPKSFNINEVIDSNFQHLYQKRRNLINHQAFYSIDRFQQKSSKYKWIGKSNLADSTEELKKKMLVECLVFSVYNHFGIKTPERRLSYQKCANVVGQKLKEGLMHVMTFDNPELQYLPAFQDFNYIQKKIPFSEVITFKASRQPIKFNNYGGFLALAYFLNDYQIYNQHNTSIGLVIVNEAVKQIHKLSAMNFQIHPQVKSGDEEIIVNQNNNLTMKINRLSVNVELDFFSMLARITEPNTFDQLLKYIKQIFLHAANSYQQFKMTILSLHLQQPFERTVQDFISMLENRVIRIREAFKGKLYTYKKYHSLTPIIKYSIPFDHKIERKLSFKDKVVNLHDIVKHLRNNNTLVLIEGEEGSGKTSLLNEMVTQLKAIEKINVMLFPWLKRDSLKIKNQIFQLSKNIVLIDNAEHLNSQVIELIELLKQQKCEASYCVLTTSKQQIQLFKNRFNTLNLVQTKLLPFNTDQIKEYLMKVIKWRSYTDKKDTVEALMSKDDYLKILENPFFLSLLSYNVSAAESPNFKVIDRDMTKYMIIKQHFSLCTSLHSDQMKQMGFKIKQALPNLRKMAFEYYHNVYQMNQVIKEIVSQYEEQSLIRNQLAYYPLCLESVVSANYQSLFTHRIFLNYFLVQAYSYFVEKAYRNMKMEKFYNDSFLLELINQRYKLEDSYNKLLEVVYSTKKFKTISEASSNAITLLNKIGYIFSNLNFDDVVIPQADLSNSVFYQCSFRGADLQQTIMYKSQMISCVFDAATMNKISLFSKKYEIQFTAMTCSLSVDGKKIAFGCGNYLIIVNAETGAESKRIQAHLDIIRLVKFTRDGNSLITIADDKTLRIWDIYTFKSVVFKLPQKGSISYSNQTQSIASVNKNSLKVWNLKSMANQAQLEGHTQAITTVQFSYDGQLILTGSKDTTLRLWTLRGKQKMVYKGHDQEVVAGKLSPVKRTMLSSSKSKDLIVWQVETGSKLQSKKFMSEINEISLDNKQKYVVVTFNSDNHIVVLDFLTLVIVHALKGHQAKIISLSFDYNFQQLVSLGKDRTARVWQFQKIMSNEVKNPKIYQKIAKGAITALAYDKGKFKYVTAHETGELNVWNAVDHAHLEQLHSHSGPVKCLSIDKSGKIYSGGQDGALRIWNLQVRKEPKIIQIHSSQILQLKLSQRSRIIATSSVANELVIQDFTGIKIIMSTRQEGRISAIAFSQDQKYLAVGGAEKYVAIYELINANSVNRAIELGQHSDPVTSICFFSDALIVVALKNGQVAIWNYQKVSLVKKIENVSPIRSLLLFQKKYLTLSSDDGKVRIVNMDEGREIRVFRYSQPVAALDTNQDQSLLFVGTDSGNVLKWNLSCVKPPSKKIEFDRKAIDRDCTQIVTIQGARILLVRDLLYHKETFLEVKVDSDIEGVTFDDEKIILLLKNGKYWQFGKKQYKFNTSGSYEGDLFGIRDKNVTNFYRSGLKKIKGMNKPSLAVIEEVNVQ